MFFEVHDRAAQVLSQLPNSGKVSVFDDFLKRNWGKKIEQIKDLSEVFISYMFLIPTLRVLHMH